MEPVAEPDSILLGVTLNSATSLVNINGRAHTPNSVVHQLLLVGCMTLVNNLLWCLFLH